MTPKVYIALPVMNEFENLPKLMDAILAQDYKDFELWVCVNQPDSWWKKAEKILVCENNRESITFFQDFKEFTVHLIDRSSKGKAWDEKRFGVGWARKILMDEISKKAEDDDIILSLDADTLFNPGYFSSIVKTIQSFPKAVAVSVPYYHPLTGDMEMDRHILRYEIYMRYYSLNLWRINNPYKFTALGSAIALPVWSYQRVKGITPHKSGEDFYFLLKLRKFGKIINWNPERVYPAARYSDRVFFGTGPAMIKGKRGDWASYPIYNYQLFDDVKVSFDVFSSLFEKEVDFPMKTFLARQFKDEKWFVKLRENNPKQERFYKACTDKVDALRILQYLKKCQKEGRESDEDNLISFFGKFYPESPMNTIVDFNFDSSSVSELDRLRNFMVLKEQEYQKDVWEQ